MTATGYRLFHVTRADRDEIRACGLRPARYLFPDEYPLAESEPAGDADYVWFFAMVAPDAGSDDLDVWELTRPELYDPTEDSNYENGGQHPYYRTGAIDPEHLTLARQARPAANPPSRLPPNLMPGGADR